MQLRIRPKHIHSTHLDRETLKEFLSTELCRDLKAIGDEEITTDEPCDLTQSEIFEIGMKYGQEREKAFWTKPESFILSKRGADILKECVKQFPENYHIDFESISFRDNGRETEEIIFKPTEVIHLFNLAKDYGQECMRQEYEDKLKEMKDLLMEIKTDLDSNMIETARGRIK